MHGALLRASAVRTRHLYYKARDVNGCLRYAAEAVRIRLFALSYITARRGFSHAIWRYVSVRLNLNLIIRRS